MIERHSQDRTRTGSGLLVLGFFPKLHRYMAVETLKKKLVSRLVHKEHVTVYAFYMQVIS